MNTSISGPPAAPPLSMTGNQVIVKTLVELGVDTVFGYIVRASGLCRFLMLLRPFISGKSNCNGNSDADYYYPD